MNHLFSGIRKNTRKKLTAIISKNRLLKDLRYSKIDYSYDRFLTLGFFGNFSAYLLCLSSFFFLYSILMYFDIDFINKFSSLDFMGEENDFFTALITVIALVFPLALALVTFIVQHTSSQSIPSDLNLYHSEGKFTEIGSVCLLLAIIFCLTIVFNKYDFSKDSVILKSGFKAALPILHIYWLIICLFLVSRFFKVTLQMLSPHKKAELRKKHFANKIIPQQLYNFLFNETLGQMSATDNKLEAVFSINIGRPRTKIEVSKKGKFKIRDIRLNLLSLIIKKISDRLPENTGGLAQMKYLYFPIFAGEIYQDKVTITQSRGFELTNLEQWLIKKCFIFESDYNAN